MYKKIVLLACLSLLIASCASRKNLIYLNQSDVSRSDAVNYENTLQCDDNLLITVTSSQPELANDYNLMYLSSKSTEVTSSTNTTLYTYLIDKNGEIDFPGIGKIKLAGLTRIEAEQKIKDSLKDYLKDPGVILRVLNFQVSVLGEVARPGTVSVRGDRITIFEAISSAGDLTIYGKRNNVTIIREKDGVKTINEVDLRDSNVINSPFYYLAHNDVVYVKPNKTRINSSAVGPNLTVGISALSLLITIISLSTR